MQRVSVINNGDSDKHTATLRERSEGSSHSGGHFDKGIDAGLGDHGLERVLGDASVYPKTYPSLTTLSGIAGSSRTSLNAMGREEWPH